MVENLKHSPEGLMEAFEHHLVYEVNMLRQAFDFLHVPAWRPELRNMIIELFCVHARNLIGFFDENSATPGQSRSDYVGARHFCRNDYEPWRKGRPSNELSGRLNRQVSHLSYDRTSQNEGKIGPKDQLELVRLIEQELEIFGNCLREPYANRWPFRGSVAQMEFPAGPLGATNHTTSISTYVGGWTGSAAPTTKWVIES